MQSSKIDFSFIPHYNQGKRQTCMACAVCSLLGYYFRCHGQDIVPSPQYLYGWCKNEDQNAYEPGIPHIETAFNIVKDHGVCENNVMRNNPNLTPDGSTKDEVESLIQTSPDRLMKLPDMTYAEIPLFPIPTKNPFNNIEECKQYLNGSHGLRPMPVVIACKFDNSPTARLKHQWFTKNHGDIVDYHAMLITDYCDTPRLTSKGYFWALNSWEEDKFDDQKHKYMVKIPYEDFIGGIVIEAGTIREKMPAENDNHLVGNNMDHNIHPTSNITNTLFQTSFDVFADKFFSSLMSNLKQSTFSLPYDLFPAHKSLLHSLLNAFCLQFKKAQVGEINKASCSFMGFIGKNYTDFHPLQERINIIPLCKNKAFRIITAVLSHDDGTPITIEDITRLRVFTSERLTSSDSCPKPHDLIVVAATVFNDDCQGQHSSNLPPIILCTPTDNNLWDYRLPKSDFSKRIINFLLHALPGSANEYADHMASLIQNWPKPYMTKDDLCQKLSLHPSVPVTFIDYWLKTLFKRGVYAMDSHGYIYNTQHITSQNT